LDLFQGQNLSLTVAVIKCLQIVTTYLEQQWLTLGSLSGYQKTSTGNSQPTIGRGQH
jgi:hypothetical protein